MAERFPVPDQTEEIRIRGTRVYSSLVGGDAQVWYLPVNGLVIPVGVAAGMQGALAQALRRELGEDLWVQLRDLIQTTSRGRIDAFSPVHVPIRDPDLGPALLPNAPQPRPGEERYHVIAATVGSLDASQIEGVERVAEAVVEAAALGGVWRLALPTLGTGRGPFSDQGCLVGKHMVRGVCSALRWLPEGSMGEITLTSRDPETIECIQEEAKHLVANVPQRLLNDEPRGPDLLGIGAEVSALAEAALLQNVVPPLAIGILGGWGSGKSFVMNLMRRRMQEIRGYASPGWPADQRGLPDTPYVGHVYQIEFNAWTYAKSNLWASLMQTIFVELSRQLTLEKQLADALTESLLAREQATPSGQPVEDHQIRRMELERQAWLDENYSLWPVLYAAGDNARRLLLETEAGRAVLARWQAGEIPDDTLWAHLEGRTREETEALERMRDELAKARQELDQELEKTVGLSPGVLGPVLDKLEALLDESVLKKLKTRLAKDDADALQELYGLAPDALSVLKAAERRPLETAAILLFALIVGAVPFLLPQVEWRIPGGILSAATLLAGSLRAVVRVQGALNQIREEYKSDLEVERARQRAGEATLLEPQAVKDLRQKVADLEDKVTRQERRVGLTSQYRSLHELVQSRLEEGYYERQLGLMHRVERDLKELTEALYIGEGDPYLQQKRALFPRGQPRVVLFIDDLDRCPPERVVEALEAVQLLLKTELFIVVLGVDTRYVTRALEKAYEGILTAEGEPSGLDYIEKILTLGYRAQPIRPEAASRFLRGQGIEVEIVVEETQPGPGPVPPGPPGPGPGHRPGPQPGEPVEWSREPPLEPVVVKFTPDQYKAIEKVCQGVQLTARSLKRIGNVMKLVKIFWHRTNMSPSPAEVQMTAALLALSARYPEVMRDAFVEVEAHHGQEPEETWLGCFEAFVERKAPRNPHVRELGGDFLHDAQKLIPERMTLGDLNVRSFDLTRSFSFVGDPTPAVEQAQRVELVR